MKEEILSVMPNVHIDEEFNHLIPRMMDPEYEDLEKSVKEHGFDKPVIDVLPQLVADYLGVTTQYILYLAKEDE